MGAHFADTLNPDIAGIGGLLDFLKVVDLADLQGVQVSPHCWITLTVASVAMAKIYPEYLSHEEKFATNSLRLDGANVYLLRKLGLEVEIDVPALQSIYKHHQATNLTIVEVTP